MVSSQAAAFFAPPSSRGEMRRSKRVVSESVAMLTSIVGNVIEWLLGKIHFRGLNKLPQPVLYSLLFVHIPIPKYMELHLLAECRCTEVELSRAAVEERTHAE
jgi:hypothetical protein